MRSDPQEGNRVLVWEQHDPSTVYVLFDCQRPISEPKQRLLSELMVVTGDHGP